MSNSNHRPTDNDYSIGANLSSPVQIPIVDTSNGLSIGRLYKRDLGNLRATLPDDADPTQSIEIPAYLAVMYDLGIDPSEFNPDVSNIRPGRLNLRAIVTVNRSTVSIRREKGQTRELADFLKERRELEDRILGSKHIPENERGGHRKDYVSVIVCERIPNTS